MSAGKIPLAKNKWSRTFIVDRLPTAFRVWAGQLWRIQHHEGFFGGYQIKRIPIDKPLASQWLEAAGLTLDDIEEAP